MERTKKPVEVIVKKLTTLCALVVFFTLGAEARKTDGITIWEKTKAANKSLKLTFKNTKHAGVNFKINHSQEEINPNKKVMQFSGIELLDFLNKNNNFPNKKNINLVSIDSYTIQMPVADFIKSQALIATDGSSIKKPWSLGFPTLMFRNKDHKDFQSNPAWGAWWVSTVILDDLNPILSIQNKEVDLNKAVGTITPSEDISYPRGQRVLETPKKLKKKISKIAINKLLPENQKSEFVKVHFMHTNKTFRIKTADLNQYFLAFKWNNKEISSTFGGPIQLCSQKLKECKYFVKRISW